MRMVKSFCLFMTVRFTDNNEQDRGFIVICRAFDKLRHRAVGELVEPMASIDFVHKLKQSFHVSCTMCNELLRRPVRRVAVCGGAGDFLLDEAVKAGADAFVTGEMHYHQYFGYEQQIQICVIGHYQSEQFTSEIFEEIIERECPGVRTFIAETNTNPILYI